jgi:hypothetical protein
LKKLTYLFLALLLPALIFVFLKYGGSNRFDIPVYYEDGVELPTICSQPNPGAYLVPDSVWQRIGGRRAGNVVIFFEKAIKAAEIGKAVQDEISNTRISISDGMTFAKDSMGRAQWRACSFVMKAPWQTVLFDSLGRIRGYYDLGSRDEIDRLRVELKILLEQY